MLKYSVLTPQTQKNMVLTLFVYKKALLMFKWIASFSGFTWPKTILAPETERGLTSEFGMGSGGSHALWPATQLLCLSFGFLMFRLCSGNVYIVNM